MPSLVQRLRDRAAETVDIENAQLLTEAANRIEELDEQLSDLLDDD